MIENKVKLVVWDLDETFWRGTLSEEGIEPLARNAEIVISLSKRGIVNSICSKNDFEQAKAKLVELGIWDYFVFPCIAFAPKGKAVAEMIEAAALRPENVLFIDDNRSNLEEVKFFNENIMAAHPAEVLDGLLDHPHLAGKPDPELTRLKQYKFLQRKVEERDASLLSNEDFLRASDIRVRIDYDIEANFERVVDLVNRANQLNYTKQRLETREAIAELRESLSAFGMHGGCVSAIDRYGDYGLIGFFLLKRRFSTNRLVHFVFSCRTMNMGIEQYVHEMLGRPEIDIVEPVSYGLDSHAHVDWISDGGEGAAMGGAGGKSLVLVGGCDLLQLASYCSSERHEFVNSQRDGAMVRYDDPGFIVSDRAAIRDCKAIRDIPLWTYDDAVRFDAALASCELILVSMWAAMNMTYLKACTNVALALKPSRVRQLERADPRGFAANFEKLDLDEGDKHARIEASFDAVAAKCRTAARIFVLGCYTKGPLSQKQPRRREAFNAMCRRHCERRPERFRYVDLDAVMPVETLVANAHFSRMGYFTLARHILDLAAAPEPVAAS